MPRPQLLTREIALEKAMRLFWEKGYNATSTRDLEKVTGLGTSSIYNSFGSKEDLFFSTLQHYLEAEKRKLNQSIADIPSALKAIRALFECVLQGDSTANKKLTGCFLVNSVTELANLHPRLNQFAADSRIQTIDLLKKLLRKAQEQNEIPLNKSPDQLAIYLHTLMIGLKVTGMLVKDKKELKSTIDVIIENLANE